MVESDYPIVYGTQDHHFSIEEIGDIKKHPLYAVYFLKKAHSITLDDYPTMGLSKDIPRRSDIEGPFSTKPHLKGKETLITKLFSQVPEFEKCIYEEYRVYPEHALSGSINYSSLKQSREHAEKVLRGFGLPIEEGKHSRFYRFFLENAILESYVTDSHISNIRLLCKEGFYLEPSISMDITENAFDEWDRKATVQHYFSKGFSYNLPFNKDIDHLLSGNIII
jgi:hypothetical protein